MSGTPRSVHSLQIMGGEFRSRRLATPRDETTRPMSSRAKESIFNLLRGWFDDTAVLDLFAGVGTMGLEAVSRGAARVVMVERDRSILRLLQQNIASLGCADRTVVVPGDALSASVLTHAKAPIDIVFIDPPYATMELDSERRRVFEQVARCRAVMAEKSFVVLRSPLDPREIDHTIADFDGPEKHAFGEGMWVLLYAPKRG